MIVPFIGFVLSALLFGAELSHVQASATRATLVPSHMLAFAPVASSSVSADTVPCNRTCEAIVASTLLWAQEQVSPNERDVLFIDDGLEAAQRMGRLTDALRAFTEAVARVAQERGLRVAAMERHDAWLNCSRDQVSPACVNAAGTVAVRVANVNLASPGEAIVNVTLWRITGASPPASWSHIEGWTLEVRRSNGLWEVVEASRVLVGH